MEKHKDFMMGDSDMTCKECKYSQKHIIDKPCKRCYDMKLFSPIYNKNVLEKLGLDSVPQS